MPELIDLTLSQNSGARYMRWMHRVEQMMEQSGLSKDEQVGVLMMALVYHIKQWASQAAPDRNKHRIIESALMDFGQKLGRYL